MNRSAIVKLEEHTLSAWPAFREVTLDGWVLRFAGGYTRRSNSVNPLYPGTLAADEKVAECERAYRGQGLPVVFKLTAASEPTGLDELLLARGYREEARVSVQGVGVADGAFESQPPRRVRESATPSDPWLHVYATFNGVSDANRVHLRGILERIKHPCLFLLLMDEAGDEPVACGLAVHQGEQAMLFDIATGPAFRRRGHGAALMNHLLHWCGAAGARTAYLQVMLDNAAAYHMYAKLGFREHHHYGYRVTS